MKRIIATEKAPKAIGPYSQAVAAGKLLFISGQISLDPFTGEMLGATAAEQAVQVFKNIKAILEAAGIGFGDVVKATVLLKNMADFASVNEVYARQFSGDFPARAAFEVAALPRGALVEIEAIATLE